MAERNGLGDILDPSLRKTLLQWAHLGRRRWIVKPEWIPEDPPGMEAVGKLIEGHVLPRAWQLLADLTELIRSGVYRVQPPGWLEPPYGSEPEDIVSETPVALANGAPVTVVSYQVPDRHVASFPRFGHGLDVAAQFGVVSWTIQVNKKPIRTYRNFLQQRGSIIDPTPMAKPITLKGKDLLEVLATGGPVSVNATARLPGWVMAATSVTQDGSQIEWNAR